ncbi:hypothetical protein HW571_22930 [Agrobacterium genomosp. 3]|uniref:Mercuric ion transport protein n=4 Tax=Rhizobiaceae TaxID=82115 RepID=L0NLZ1_9HYPH|nr:MULTISPECIES: hypothetical protein [Hyphomicrobiales]MBU1313862.1 hypothetical protein [Alphaproteobacteria bacterium]MCA1868533.1 hypothetical protein [Agrobacterium tomkonis]CUX65049.1 conserved hypothetical protein [Agrobacterium genomosp. 5 str. CFBP 6626]MBU1551421.1 hypothetical protein [Alphaproteobacteria bacterium]MBU2336975.1 hypothetical protein [Alphaproteobacteria bacterium]
MDDKPTAGIVTAIIIAPLVALCCLGPVVIGSAVGGVLGWFSGQGLVIGGVLTLLAGAAGYALMRWRRASSRREDASPTCTCDEPKARPGSRQPPTIL